MQTSEQINEIAAALAKAQGEMGGALKDASNPFFKSKYADLASVMEACRPALSKHGIAVVQSPRSEGATVSLDTMLLHASGQWIRGTATTTAKDDSPQSLGSAITYLRRYALQSFAGVAPEDDDGEAAQGRGNGPTQKSAAAPKPAAPPAPKGYQGWLDDMAAVTSEGTERLQTAWKGSKAEYRQYLIATNPNQWQAMKDAAEKVAAA